MDSSAAFYQVRRIKPSVSMVTPGPIDGSSWVDTQPESGTNTYVNLSFGFIFKPNKVAPGFIAD